MNEVASGSNNQNHHVINVEAIQAPLLSTTTNKNCVLLDEERFYLCLAHKLLGDEYVIARLSEWIEAQLTCQINSNLITSIHSQRQDFVTSRDGDERQRQVNDDDGYRCLYWRSCLLDDERIQQIRRKRKSDDNFCQMNAIKNCNIKQNDIVFVDIRFEFGDIIRSETQEQSIKEERKVGSTTTNDQLLPLIQIRFGLMYLNHNVNHEHNQNQSCYYVISKNPIKWNDIQNHFISLAIDVKNTPLELLANIMSQSLNSINTSIDLISNKQNTHSSLQLSNINNNDQRKTSCTIQTVIRGKDPIVKSISLYYEDFQQYSTIPILYNQDDEAMGKSNEKDITTEITTANSMPAGPDINDDVGAASNHNTSLHDDDENDEYSISVIDDIVLEMIMLSNIQKTTSMTKVMPSAEATTRTSSTSKTSTPDRRSKSEDKMNSPIQPVDIVDVELHQQKAIASSFQLWKDSYRKAKYNMMTSRNLLSVDAYGICIPESNEMQSSTTDQKTNNPVLNSECSTIPAAVVSAGLSIAGNHVPTKKKRTMMHGFSKLTNNKRGGSRGGSSRLQYNG